MKVLVAVKRVIDATTHIRVKADGSGVELNNVKMAINPFDEIAVEEAVRLKEQGVVTEIVVVSIGSNAAQEILRSALAMGADRAILIETDMEVEPLTAAKILRALTAQEVPQLIILGKQAIDSDNNQVGQMLAGLLNWPQGTFASKVTIMDNKAEVVREVDGGLETVLLTLPAVITTDLRLNEPRYLSLPNIVQSKRKPFNKISVNDLGVQVTPRLKTLNVTAPVKKRAGIMVTNARELVEKLRHDTRVIE